MAYYKKLAEIVGGRSIVKFTIPSLNQMLYSFLWDTGVYASKDEFVADLHQAYIDAVQVFYDAGCRYLQLDDVYWSSLKNGFSGCFYFTERFFRPPAKL